MEEIMDLAEAFKKTALSEEGLRYAAALADCPMPLFDLLMKGAAMLPIRVQGDGTREGTAIFHVESDRLITNVENLGCAMNPGGTTVIVAIDGTTFQAKIKRVYLELELEATIEGDEIRPE